MFRKNRTKRKKTATPRAHEFSKMMQWVDQCLCLPHGIMQDIIAYWVPVANIAVQPLFVRETMLCEYTDMVPFWYSPSCFPQDTPWAVWVTLDWPVNDKGQFTVVDKQYTVANWPKRKNSLRNVCLVMTQNPYVFEIKQ